MHISGEGRIGFLLGLIGIGGAGAVWVVPNHTEIGWVLIAIAVIGVIVLGWHHFRETRSPLLSLGKVKRLGALIIIAAGVAITGIGVAWYFWPSKPEEHVEASSLTTQTDYSVNGGRLPTNLGMPNTVLYATADIDRQKIGLGEDFVVTVVFSNKSKEDVYLRTATLLQLFYDDPKTEAFHLTDRVQNVFSDALSHSSFGYIFDDPVVPGRVFSPYIKVGDSDVTYTLSQSTSVIINGIDSVDAPIKIKADSVLEGRFHFKPPRIERNDATVIILAIRFHIITPQSGTFLRICTLGYLKTVSVANVYSPLTMQPFQVLPNVSGGVVCEEGAAVTNPPAEPPPTPTLLKPPAKK